MRRRGIAVLILAVIAAALVGVWSAAYRLGDSSGRSKVAADRSAFLTRVPSNPQGAAAAGTPGASGARGAGGSAAAGAGGQRTGGSPGSGQQAVGTQSAPVASAPSSRTSGVSPQSSSGSVAGRVTKIDGATISVQQTDSTIVVVTTDGQTIIRQLVPGVLTDLKTGDVIAVVGGKTADTTYSAKTITSIGPVTGATSGGVGQSLSAVPPGGSAPALTGQIKSVNGGTLTVQSLDGATVTVTSSPATVVKTQQPGTLSTITTGDLLLVQGDKTGATTLLARSITDQGAS
ncbi:MAG: DUF5666 domain-containing protein [Thermomicrobiales bacterium]